MGPQLRWVSDPLSSSFPHHRHRRGRRRRCRGARPRGPRRRAGLTVASNYQFGKGETSDWLGGYPAGLKHGRRGAQLHAEAGGPPTAPIYVSIDDNPTFTQFVTLIAPYLLAWHTVIGPARTGVYANAATIEWASSLGLARWFWQHGWGTPEGYVHPAAHLRQLRGQRTVGGVNVDVNTILRADYGQWA